TSTTVYVRIVDENDNAPEFPEEEYVTVLSEGPDTVGATIATCPIPGLRLTSSTTVLVNVLDVNDRTPTFPNAFEGPFEVTEGQPGPRVCNLRVVDEDSGLNGKVEYSITAGDPQNEFMVSPVEGELRVRRDVELDRETTPYYNITVTARDLGTPPRSST
ncbi:hypothetical protein CRUP_008989, partial [Coryphaenoides rupestris]